MRMQYSAVLLLLSPVVEARTVSFLPFIISLPPQSRREKYYSCHLHSVNDLRPAQVSFEVADALTAEFTAASYDVVYSRDTFLHVKNKAALFKR